MQPDLDFVRRHFPGLASPWAFMDNAGGSHVLAAVADRVRDFLLTTPVQHGASYAPSQEAAAKVREATAAIARMINARSPEEVVLGGSTTFLFQQLARAMASSVREGDEIVVTDVDHESNVGPWRELERRGAVLREWRVDPETFELDLAALERLLGPRTRLVCVTHCSNVLGTVMPIPEIARLVHAAGAELCVDGVAYAPHRARRRAGARLRLVRLQLLQDLRAAPGGALGPPRAAAGAGQPEPLVHRQGPRCPTSSSPAT